MALQEIEIPDSIRQLKLSERAAEMIDEANERIEAFMLADQAVIENFVTCDFHLLAHAMEWIKQNHLTTGNRFCEWGCGFGIAAMLAAIDGMESVGIEIESDLVDQASDLADALGINARFYCDSFVPREAAEPLEEFSDVKHVDTQESDVYQEIGLAIDDFDLFFAFPWPGENGFFETVLDCCGASGSMLLTYRGREGMHLLRKV